MRETRSSKGSTLIPAFLILLILACGIVAGRDLYQYYAARQEYSAMDQALITQSTQEDVGFEPAPEEFWYPNLEIDYAGYEAINEGFVGVLYFPYLDIRYPVAISRNNIEYLTTTFEGTTNPSGCIFMDYQNRQNWTDRNTYIYGHNMRDGSMFGRLKELTQDAALDGENLQIYIYSPERILQYQVLCVEIAPSDANFGNIRRDSQYDIYIDEIRSRSWYWDEEINLSERPNLLTLYTCYGSGHTQKLLVHATLINELEVTNE